MALFSKFDRHADLVGRMADTLDVDLVEAAEAGQIGETALRSTVLACMGCEAPGACEGWLSDHSDGAAATPDYCRNKAMLDRLAAS